MKAVRHHTACRWVLLYIERWLTAPVQQQDGALRLREKGTPQGGVITPRTQKVTWTPTRRRRSAGACRAAIWGRCRIDRNAMTNDDAFVINEYILDDETHDALAFHDVKCVRGAT